MAAWIGFLFPMTHTEVIGGVVAATNTKMTITWTRRSSSTQCLSSWRPLLSVSWRGTSSFQWPYRNLAHSDSVFGTRQIGQYTGKKLCLISFPVYKWQLKEVFIQRVFSRGGSPILLALPLMYELWSKRERDWWGGDRSRTVKSSNILSRWGCPLCGLT